ncbi:hypothetical protein IAU60_004124 [Kwoniella sp. DSM 27419]
MEENRDPRPSGSRSPSPRAVRPTSPETVRSPQGETDAIALKLAASKRARRRRSLGSILRASKPPQPPGKGKGRADELAIEEDDDEDEAHGGLVVGPEPDDIAAYNAAKGDPIKLYHHLGNGRQEQEGEEDDPTLESEYVWDVLFENQRGIYLLGKGFFSSRSLLPADPSAFTRPTTELFNASSFSIVDPAKGKAKTQAAGFQVEGSSRPSQGLEQPNPGVSHVHGKKLGQQRPHHNAKAVPSRSNKTSYTLETLQPPLPEWEYLTPWMINMRLGTDEAGWRYNAWFKKKGWSSHAGPVGWGGWVRRREWVRLRYIEAQGPNQREKRENTNKSPVEDGEDRPQARSPRHVSKLSEVMRSERPEDNVQNLLKTMAGLALDRRRLEQWDTWLDAEGDSSEGRRRLREICNEAEAFELLKHQFTYSTSFPTFTSLLRSHGIMPSADSASTSAAPTEPSKRTSPASPHS